MYITGNHWRALNTEGNIQIHTLKDETEHVIVQGIHNNKFEVGYDLQQQRRQNRFERYWYLGGINERTDKCMDLGDKEKSEVRDDH